MRISSYNILILLLMLEYSAVAQVVQYDTLLTAEQSHQIHHITMHGSIDGETTFSAIPYYRVFEPMESIEIRNNGHNSVIHPRIVFNNRGKWFDISSMREECFGGATTQKEKALALWKFFTDNRIHEVEPSYDDINDPVKMFGIYGNGMCYNTNYINGWLAQNETNGPYKGYSPNGYHFVSELKFGDYMLLDSDIETFYLLSDNNTIGGFEDITADRNLIRRTHHYGKMFKYSDQINSYLSSLYQKDQIVWNAGYKQNYHSLDFILRPHESVTYKWNEDQFSPRTQGEFCFKTNFKDDSLNLFLDQYANIKSDTLPHIHAVNINEEANFVVKVECPYLITDGSIKIDSYRASLNDSLALFFSKDSVQWEKIWGTNSIGQTKDSINTGAQIQAFTSPALYKYFIKCVLYPKDSANACGLDSLEIHTDFQVSKFFLPHLKLGENTVEYTNSNPDSTSLQIQIKWKESSENTPPEAIVNPVFPSDQSDVDSLKFTFHWEVPADPDMDEITDYHFQLSDLADMKYPLSSTFDVYIKPVSDTLKSQFKIPEYGLLNNNTTYYWRVRAKDSNGAWAEWSTTWSFIPHGVMMPLNSTISVRDSGIVLSWENNSAGSTPQHYEIHSSDEWMGFTPSVSTLFDTTSSTHYVLHYDTINPSSFYRIIAVAANGDKSNVSVVAQLPYPYILTKIDSIMPNNTFNLKLETNKLWYAFVNNYTIDRADDSISTIILSKPDWLSFNADSTALVGSLDTIGTYKMLVDTNMTRIHLLHIASPSGLSQYQIIDLKSTYKNLPPGLSDLDTLIGAGDTISKQIDVWDKDSIFGDVIQIEILSQPSWAIIEIVGNSIQLLGTPNADNLGDTVIVVRLTDLHDNITEKTFPIKIQCIVYPATAGAISAPETICEGSAEVPFVTGSIFNASSYVWTVSNENPIEGANSIKMDFQNLTPDSYTLAVKGNRGGCYGASSYYAFSIEPKIEIISTLQVEKNPVCYGDSIKCTVDVLNEGDHWIYDWHINNSIIKQNTHENSFITSEFENENDVYVLITATDSSKCYVQNSVFSDKISLRINQLPEPEIILTDGILNVFEEGHYTWFFNELELPDTNYFIYPKVVGEYKVKFVDMNNCMAFSPSYVLENLAVGSTMLNTFPNPTDGIFNVLIDKEMQDASVSVFDALGTKIFSTYIGSEYRFLEIDLTERSSGLYFLFIESKEKRWRTIVSKN